jgi:hypothetical protein
MRHWFLLVCCLLVLHTVSATHIVGGSIFYSCVNNQTHLYNITLEVLRDCYNGAPDAYFDMPASIGIFNENNQLVTELRPEPFGYELLSVLDSNSICQFPENVCVERALYEAEVTLPPIPGGYTVVYMRCCRSGIIQNLVDPLNTGMTFMTHIDPQIENSAPRFNSPFPFAVATNTAFVYDASAFDVDGDSLVYVLATPFVGADIIMNRPQPPYAPPYEQAIWRSPFTVDNMMGGNFPLTLDRKTGRMIAIPTNVGVFQIAYEVKEYRQGNYIGSTFREFAFVVAASVPGETYEITGRIVGEPGDILNEGKVQLLQRIIANDSFVVLAETDIQPDASYAFNAVPPGAFYLKAILNPSNPDFDAYIPTYYAPIHGSPFWYQSEPLKQCDTSNLYRDIYMVHSSPNPGPNILDGTVLRAGRSFEPVPGLDLVLIDHSFFYYEHQTTDENGYFKFEGLGDNAYHVYVDQINSTVLNNNPPGIDLNANRTITLFLYSDSLSLEEPTAVQGIDIFTVALINVFPNPTRDVMKIAATDLAGVTIAYEITNLHGQTLKTGTLVDNATSTITMQDWPSGLYTIKASNGKATQVLLFLKE